MQIGDAHIENDNSLDEQITCNEKEQNLKKKLPTSKNSQE